MNKLKLYNTLTRTKEVFEPIESNKVSMYHCGPTVYWTQHIGNLRSIVMADIIVRTFKYLDYDLTLVRNYTDVGHLTSDGDTGEDKMEKGAKREGLTPDEIAQKYINIFEKDCNGINILDPQFKPKATQHVNEMIAMVDTLVKNNFAYLTEYAVYFDISKVDDYTKLSKQNLDKNIAGAGSGDANDLNKKNPNDFALWIFKAGQYESAVQTWKSPFESSLVENGEGFPGWHIECSAMSKKYLGDTIDIHMGGIEHIPVHHTNEIAQSESANGVPFAHYWLHNEHLLVNNAKMAKSEGTGYALSEVESRGYDPLDLRYLYLGANYRSKQNFTWESLKAARNSRINLKKAMQDLPDSEGVINHEYKEDFRTQLADDFNTPKALAIVYKVLASDINPSSKKATLIDFDKVLGLKLSEIKKTEVVLKKIAVGSDEISIEYELDLNPSEEILNLIVERQKAKKISDWDNADKLRNQLLEHGYAIMDSSDKIVLTKSV